MNAGDFPLSAGAGECFCNLFIIDLFITYLLLLLNKNLIICFIPFLCFISLLYLFIY